MRNRLFATVSHRIERITTTCSNLAEQNFGCDVESISEIHDRLAQAAEKVGKSAILSAIEKIPATKNERLAMDYLLWVVSDWQWDDIEAELTTIANNLH